jgi:hypothetical protein
MADVIEAVARGIDPGAFEYDTRSVDRAVAFAHARDAIRALLAGPVGDVLRRVNTAQIRQHMGLTQACGHMDRLPPEITAMLEETKGEPS